MKQIMTCNMGVVTIPVLSLLVGLAFGVSTTYDVAQFGAVGDGKKDDSQSFLNAWSSSCNDSGSPTFLIPSGKTFLLSQLSFTGPCKSSIHVQILGNLVAPSSVWKVQQTSNWITFSHVDSLTIDGTGQIDGQGSPWWSCRDSSRCSSVPNALGVLYCNNFQLGGVKFINAPSKHVSLYGSVGVLVTGITIEAPSTSPNTDGVHIQQCQHVQITGSNIASGDDCIAIGNGTSDANITNINCGPGHGISIGSLGMNKANEGVEQAHISHCGFFNTNNGARIKTWQGGSGFARGITFENLNISNVEYPILIDQFYCPDDNCPIQPQGVQVSDIRFIGIRGTTTSDVPIQFNCSQGVPCTGIYLQDVTLQPSISSKANALSSFCMNAHGSVGGDVSPPVTCLQQ